MSTQLLDGKKLAIVLKDQIRNEIIDLRNKYGVVPVAVSILSTNDDAAIAYSISQKKTADELGIDYRIRHVSSEITPTEFENLIQELNADQNIHAVLINKPVPEQINFSKMVNLLSDQKEVEGINEVNLGRLFLGQTDFIPCTAAAVMEHFKYAQISLKGKEVVLVGRSEIVGKPLLFLFLAQHATVTICHSATESAGRLKDHLKRADIIVMAIGKPKFLHGDWIKPGAVVIDVGINRVEGKMVGDVDFDSVLPVTSAITPVPGGVGPVTSVMLMKNIVCAYKQQVAR